MKVLVTGKGGQLAWELEQSLAQDCQLISLSSAELDITQPQQIERVFAEHQPNVVINAAAYTAVDKAESEQDSANAVNHLGAKYLAAACDTHQARLLHVSTDFIFDGQASSPYATDAKSNPVNVYGATKLAGEQAISEVLNNAVIVRTAWVYSTHGNNFVKSMLNLMQSKPQLGIVYDQIGTPTWAKGLAEWLWAIAAKPDVKGVFHWTDAGVASWYDFAVAIQELAIEKGLLEQAIPVLPIPASQYPTPANRPSFSVIDKASSELASGITTIHWRQQLSSMLDQLKG